MTTDVGHLSAADSTLRDRHLMLCFLLPERVPQTLHADLSAQCHPEGLHKAVSSHARLLSAMISITFRFESSSHFLHPVLCL